MKLTDSSSPAQQNDITADFASNRLSAFSAVSFKKDKEEFKTLDLNGFPNWDNILTEMTSVFDKILDQEDKQHQHLSDIEK